MADGQEMKFDAYSPKEMAERLETVGVTKGNLDLWTMFALSLLAGAFIAFGAMLFTLVVHDSKLGFGVTQLLGGLSFCLGLILVVITGAELFTGNNLLVMAYVSQKITLYKLLRNWFVGYIGNFLGALTMVIWVYLANSWKANGALVGVKALMIANSKVSLTFTEALVRGILCNALVCLAVWLCFSGRHVIDKILSILFPITAFVALGFEHSVANMYFIPLGILMKGESSVFNAATNLSGNVPDLTQLTIQNFLIKNLIPVTIGNIIGGGVLVAVVFWFIYRRHTSKMKV